MKHYERCGSWAEALRSVQHLEFVAITDNPPTSHHFLNYISDPRDPKTQLSYRHVPLHAHQASIRYASGSGGPDVRDCMNDPDVRAFTVARMLSVDCRKFVGRGEIPCYRQHGLPKKESGLP